MFKIPGEFVTKVRAGETLYITKIGNGKASICGEKVVIEVDSKDRFLGERFFGTGNGYLVKRLTLANSITTCKETTLVYKGRRI